MTFIGNIYRRVYVDHGIFFLLHRKVFFYPIKKYAREDGLTDWRVHELPDKRLLSALWDIGGETGIRTLDTLWGYTHFPGVLLKPLGHLSNNNSFKEGHK